MQLIIGCTDGRNFFALLRLNCAFSCLGFHIQSILLLGISGLTKLLVATGNENLFLSSVEVVNLDESDPDLICDNLPDFPLNVVGASGQLLDGTPIICGGAAQTLKWTDSCACYALTNGSWVQVC